jgi:hypothetical protein
MALLASLVMFVHVLAGFRNRDVVEQVAALLGRPYGQRQATYDLRRLRRKELIARVPGSHRYHLTPVGRAVAVLFLKAHGRILGPGFALLDLAVPESFAASSPLAIAWRRLDHALDDFISRGAIAA